jgi:hypothetical protein
MNMTLHEPAGAPHQEWTGNSPTAPPLARRINFRTKSDFYLGIIALVFYLGIIIPMSYTAFSGFDQIASGPLAEVHAASRDRADALIFDDRSGRVVDIDPRHPPEAEPTLRGPGRPRLGVVAREITLLPRHWDWLNSQPGGASVALRKLVEEAHRRPGAMQAVARQAAYRFATAIVGDAPGYEEAMRALFAGRREDFAAHVEAWPPDVRVQLEKMTAQAF